MKTLALLAIIGLMFAFTSCNSKPQQPNILYIMSDDHTSQAWGVYGSILDPYIKHPNISRLRDEGVLLENCFCTNSICVPSRAAVITGQYSHLNGVYTLSDPLEPAHDNVAKELQKNGYQTAVVGKWHLRKKPSGFDYYEVFPDQGLYFDPVMKTADTWQDGNNGGAVRKGFSTDIVSDLSLKWLQKRDPEKPFFLMCHFKATHEPFDFPERLKDMYEDVEFPMPESIMDFNRDNGRTFDGQPLENLGWRWEQASKGPWWCKYPELPFSTEDLDSVEVRKKIYQKFIKDFLRCGKAIDQNIGKLLDYLDEEGLADNTIVIYTADQGYFLGEHGFFDKRLMYEESLHMPFVIKYPQEVQPGVKNTDIILNTDFAPLFLDYAGIEKPEYMQGESFRNNLKGKTDENWRESMYYRYWTHHENRPAHYGVRTKDYKLIYFYAMPLDMTGSQKDNSGASWEFYDLKKDPNELHNAYNDKKYKSIIKDLKKQLKTLKIDLKDTDDKYPELHKMSSL